MSSKCAVRCWFVLLCALSVLGSAVAQMPNAYGAPISLENAKKAAAPALAEAAKNNWTVAVAIVDPSGNLVYYEKMDNTQARQRERFGGQGADGGAVQAAYESVSGRAGQWRRKPSHSRAAGNCSGRRRNSSAYRRQDRGRDRRLGHDQRAGQSVCQGGGGAVQVKRWAVFSCQLSGLSGSSSLSEEVGKADSPRAGSPRGMTRVLAGVNGTTKVVP